MIWILIAYILALGIWGFVEAGKFGSFLTRNLNPEMKKKGLTRPQPRRFLDRLRKKKPEEASNSENLWYNGENDSEGRKDRDTE